MTRSFIICIITSISLLFLSFQPGANNDRIYWAKDQKLSWEDFQAAPDRNSKDAAITSSGFVTDPYTIRTNSDSVSLTVNSYFNKKASWVKENAKKEIILKHEQCHFDITELYARKFRKQLASKQFSREAFKPALVKMLETTRREWDNYQNLYDKETDHSKIADKQEEWEKKVAKELKALDAYAGSTVMLYLKPSRR